MKMNFDNVLFRCSSLSNLMVEPKLKADKDAGNLSETTKKFLLEVYIKHKYNREKDIISKYTQKGLMVEEDSITLFSRLHRKFYKKNEKQLSNDYIVGTPDLFEGLEITEADEVIDIKSSWDIFTFLNTKHSASINKDYYYQLQGYMALTGAKVSKLAYCLVNTPDILIEDEKRKLMYKMNAGTDLNDEFIKASEELEKSLKFDDIDMTDRCVTYVVYRDENVINAIYEKVERARDYLNYL